MRILLPTGAILVSNNPDIIKSRLENGGVEYIDTPTTLPKNEDNDNKVVTKQAPKKQTKKK